MDGEARATAADGRGAGPLVRAWPGRFIGLAILVGVLGAAGSVVFRLAMEGATAVFHAPAARLGALGIPLALLAGGVVLLGLERCFPGDVLGYGFPRFLEMFHLHGNVKRRWIALRTIGAAVSLGAGAAVGREGPIAQIGGAIGGAVAMQGRRPIDERKLLIACGVAASIAATFNAPISGVLFVQEIVLLGEAELSRLSLVVVSAATAVATTRGLFGSAPALATTHFVLGSYWDCVTYAALGAALGILAAWYVRLFHALNQRLRALPLPRWAVLLGGLGVLGVVGVFVPQNLSDGYPVINQALAGQLAWRLTAVLAVAKAAGSALALGCGAPGGVFGPIFFIGAMVGATFRALSDALVPALTGPAGSYALIGLGAFLAATTRAPLTALFLLIEMTEGYGITVPALLTIGVSLLVAQRFVPESIDLYGLWVEGRTLHAPPVAEALERVAVGTAYLAEVERIPESCPLPDLLRIVSTSRTTNLPVVDASGLLSGVVSFGALRAVLGEGGLDGVLIAADLCDRNPPTVTPETTIASAFRTFESSHLEEIPVVDSHAPRQVLGMLSRANLIAEYNRLATPWRSLDTWVEGARFAPEESYRVATLAVPAAWVGRSLRELDCRRRFGVTVLAIRVAESASGTYDLPDPDLALCRGDLLVVAGTDAALAGWSARSA